MSEGLPPTLTAPANLGESTAIVAALERNTAALLTIAAIIAKTATGSVPPYVSEMEANQYINRLFNQYLKP